ncbi:putative N-acetyltransferase, MSMEG_0567 N-terminal domain family [Arboricoccus pini]|uniref:Putative N-acetyltransferase, MSMEG_0567 N-terminal domain family n=1 Tax=Arboricoccus pini TaxID=1963835 RepID=A0A212RL18_9PROT|nr:MSMEG_0567/Sll0786 family nitrogen starvation N-acetyltransferase [Arboricoccus pini]SNB73013.1 putative N-acetyltransferase, MSMEG_0567 N-terminal domain family [Arboricoccus pini]
MQDYRVKLATLPEECQGAAALRRQVFCQEQGLFADDDRDAIDAIALPIVALDEAGVVVGTVRIHSSEPGLWWGSRLCVHPDHRRAGPLGAALIRLAVSTAHARGSTRFLAHVQRRNVVLFRRLHWQSQGEVLLHDHPHHLMQADLDFYPPDTAGEEGFIVAGRLVA